MEQFNIHDYFIIYTLLNSSEDNPVSSYALAEKLGVSNKTVQNIISNISDYCLENGIIIKSKSGTGFYSVITDEKRMLQLKEAFDIYFSRNYIFQNKNTLQLNRFMIYLLNKTKAVSINELCDKFYLSKTTAYSYLRKTSHRFKETGITLTNNHSMLYCECPEYIRRATIAFSTSFDCFIYDYNMLFGDYYNHIDRFSYEANVLTDLLRSYGLSLNDDKFLACLSYISYSTYRYLSGCKLEIDPQTIERLKPIVEWKFVSALFKKLGLPYTNDESEIASFTMFMVIFKDTFTEINEARYGDYYYNGIDSLYKCLNEWILSRFPELWTIRNFHSKLEQFACRIYFIYEFGFNNYALNTIRMTLTHDTNALIKYLSRETLIKVNEYFGGYLQHRYANFANLFYSDLLYYIEPVRKDVSILYISKDGKAYSDHIFEWMYKHLNPAPYRIKQLNIYEANKTNLEGFDFIITNYEQFTSNTSNKPTYHIMEPIEENVEFISEYYRACYCRKKSIREYADLFEKISVYSDQKIINTKEFFSLLKKEYKNIDTFPFDDMAYHTRPINYISDNKTLIAPYLYKEGHKNMMSIYFNSDPSLKYSVLVFFSLKTDFSLISLKQLLNMCDDFRLNKDIFEKIANYRK